MATDRTFPQNSNIELDGLQTLDLIPVKFEMKITHWRPATDPRTMVDYKTRIYQVFNSFPGIRRPQRKDKPSVQSHYYPAIVSFLKRERRSRIERKTRFFQCVYKTPQLITLFLQLHKSTKQVRNERAVANRERSKVCVGHQWLIIVFGFCSMPHTSLNY